MAKNDLILLDSILDTRVMQGVPSNQRDEAFEYLVYQQVLKDYDLSQDEIISASVDGKDDGGIDAIFVFVNGHLITDISTAFWPKSNGELDIYILTCKHRNSFKQEPVNNLIASIEELLDFSIKTQHLNESYNSDVLEKRNIIISTYKKMASILCSFNLYLVYACRGDTEELGENIKARGLQAQALCENYFSSCNVKFQFWGSKEILNAYRELPSYTLSLEFQECLTQGEQYVLLARLKDYNVFITNEEGKLRKYLFDSNVRDFMGLTAVNQDILLTLEKEDGNTDFWWLNNGVTILSTGAVIVGKSITINNVQIVNGLQSSECIYRHFKNNTKDDNRFILIKVLTSQNETIRDEIIRATNNQTQVETASLHATDKVQRDIEDILKQAGLYYERRINYYANQGIPNEKIFSPLYLAAGYTALILKLPHKAVTLKNRFMREPNQYERIFSEKNQLNVWPTIAFILRKTDIELEKLRPQRNTNVESYLKSTRYTLSLLAIGKLLGKIDFSSSELSEMDISSYTSEIIIETWTIIQKYLPETWNKSNWKSRNFTMSVIEQITNELLITGIESISKRNDNIFDKERKRRNQNKIFEVSEDFIEQVLQLLPKQPWPVGVHKIVAKELTVPGQKVSQTISVLIQRGVVHRQKDGIVYDKMGNIIAVDTARNK